MYYIWGKNTNHLFKNNHKKTYSLPQKMLFPSKVPIKKISCGEDFVIILTKDGKVYFHYQSAFYAANDKVFKNNPVIDIGTDDGIMIFIAQNGQAYVSQFKHQKIINGELKPAKINLKGTLMPNQFPKVSQVFMSFGQIFLKVEQKQQNCQKDKRPFASNHLLHFKRNCWYETKTFTDPKVITSPEGKRFVNLFPSQKINVFVTDDGKIYTSSKKFPCDLEKLKINCQIKSNSQNSKITAKRFIKVQVKNNSQWFGITQDGKILTWSLKNQGQQNTQLKQFCKISKKFVDFSLSEENCFAITQDGQGWSWGKNANGQLGLSDYEERKFIYPLITLEKYFIQSIVVGPGFTCCLIDPDISKNSQGRQENLLTQKQICRLSLINECQRPVKHSIKCQQTYKIRKVEKSPQGQQSKSSNIIKKKQIIQYSDGEQQSNENSSFRMNSTQNLAFQKDYFSNKKQKKANKNGYDVENMIINRRSILNLQQKSQKKNNQKQIADKQERDYLYNIKESERSINQQKNKSLSIKKVMNKKSKALFSNSKLSNAGFQKSFANSKQKLAPNKCQQKKICCLGRSSLQKKHSISKFDSKSCKSNKSSFSSVVDKKKVLQKENSNMVTPKKINNNQKGFSDASVVDYTKYNKRIQSLISQVHSLQLENTDLKIILKQKDLIIEDVTSKIMLLEQAIEQHQKTLTSRDRTMQQNYLQQKQYQIYIIELQNQLQDLAKNMKVQISAQKRQSLFYKKQIGKLSEQIKDRISQEKTYYKDKLIQMQRLYNGQRGFYQKEMSKLKRQLEQYKNLSKQWEQSISNRNANEQTFQKILQISENNYRDSPNFQTVQMREPRQKSNNMFIDFIDEDYQNGKKTLYNKQHFGALNQKNFNVPKKMDKVGLFCEDKQIQRPFDSVNYHNLSYNSQKSYNNLSYQKQQGYNNIEGASQAYSKSHFGSIIQDIQKNKSQISKSANKLLSILQKQV